MQTFKLIIAYDGTDFHGWQIQPDKITITSCLEDCFYKTFGEKIKIIGASRTDAGVHSLYQVAKFKSNLNIDECTLKAAWNSILPKSILIRSINKIDSNFHPCANVYQKTYYYNLFLKQPLPFISRYGWFYKFIDKVDLEKFKYALQIYLGEHDFASFCKVEKEKSTIRKIDKIKLIKYPRYGCLQVTIKGKSFLRFQIRRMIGYAIDVARRNNLSLDYLKYLIDNPNPQQTLIKAKGCGLILRRIKYKNELFTKK
ncbi:tRNA pseudouridine(38-40) synthase TruA [Candidatus Dependentiae bacterium]